MENPGPGIIELKLCSQCNVLVQKTRPDYLKWQTMYFCDLICLCSYQQKKLKKQCENCDVPINDGDFGRFVYRFSDLKQFCSHTCFDQYQNTQKTCLYCMYKLGPSDPKNTFYCTNYCYTRHCLSLNKNFENIPELPHLSDGCFICKSTDVQLHVKVKTQQLKNVCSLACLQTYTKTHAFQQCSICKVYFSTTPFKVPLNCTLNNVCSEQCKTHLLMSSSLVKNCSNCGQDRYDFDLIEKCAELPAFFCSSHCYLEYFGKPTINSFKHRIHEVSQRSDKACQANLRTFFVPVLVPIPPDLWNKLLDEVLIKKAVEDSLETDGVKPLLNKGEEFSSPVKSTDTNGKEIEGNIIKEITDSTIAAETSSSNAIKTGTELEPLISEELHIPQKPPELNNSSQQLSVAEDEDTVISELSRKIDMLRESKEIVEKSADTPESVVELLENDTKSPSIPGPLLESEVTAVNEEPAPNIFATSKSPHRSAEESSKPEGTSETPLQPGTIPEELEKMDWEEIPDDLEEDRHVHLMSWQKIITDNSEEQRDKLSPQNIEKKFEKMRQSRRRAQILTLEKIEEETSQEPTAREESKKIGKFLFEKGKIENEIEFFTSDEPVKPEQAIKDRLPRRFHWEQKFPTPVRENTGQSCRRKPEGNKENVVMSKKQTRPEESPKSLYTDEKPQTDLAEVDSKQHRHIISEKQLVKKMDFATLKQEKIQNGNESLPTGESQLEPETCSASSDGEKSALSPETELLVNTGVKKRTTSNPNRKLHEFYTQQKKDHRHMKDIKHMLREWTTNSTRQNNFTVPILTVLDKVSDPILRSTFSNILSSLNLQQTYCKLDKMPDQISDEEIIGVALDCMMRAIDSKEVMDRSSSGMSGLMIQTPSTQGNDGVLLDSSIGTVAWTRWMERKKREIPPKGIVGLGQKRDENLAEFIGDLRRPNGVKTAPDSLFFLSLCIQKFLKDYGLKRNIFFDPFYKTFQNSLDKEIAVFCSRLNNRLPLKTRVLEGHLFIAGVLGADSAYSLLNSIIYLIMKHFRVLTAKAQMNLLQQDFKITNAYVRYYNNVNPAVGFEIRATTDENCPVKLFNLYFSKIPPSRKGIMFPLFFKPKFSAKHTEACWYMEDFFPEASLEFFINRLKVIKELYYVGNELIY